MDEKDKPVQVYPPEFQQLEQPLAQLKAQLSNIDQHIKQLPPDKGPQLIFRPAFDEYRPPSREQKIANFEGQKQTLKNDFFNLVETELIGHQPEKAELVRNISRKQLSIEATDIQKEALNTKENTLQEKFFANRDEILHVEQKEVSVPQVQQPEDIDEWSNRFLTLLQSRSNRQIDKDDPELDKDDW